MAKDCYPKAVIEQGLERTYRTWSSMKHRCKGKIPKYFGIHYCDRWESFSAFLSDMGPRPEGTSLDRIDPNGDYCKENCRWADELTQQNNRRNNVIIRYCGLEMTLSQYARLSDIPYPTLYHRYMRGNPVAYAFGQKIYGFKREY